MMTTGGTRWASWFGALMLLALTCGAGAQVSVAASVSAERVYVGDGVQVTVEVDGSKSPEQPVMPSVDGLLIEFAGGQDTSRHSIMIVNGNRTEQTFEGYVYSYRVLVNRPGRHVIPAITVRVDGQEYRTSPVSFTAVEPGDEPGFKLVLEGEKQTVYVGEPVKIRLVWYATGSVRGGGFSMPPANGAFELLPVPAPPGSRGQEFTLFGKPARTIMGQGELDGEACDTITVERMFVARRPGKVVMGPVRLAFDAVMGRGVFARGERKVISSGTLEFDVKPLPQPSPPSFNGLVGAYSVRAQASAREVHVGDPITLTVSVYGPEPLEALPPMLFEDQPALRGAFRASSEPAVPTVGQVGEQGRAAIYTTTLRAERDDITEIPGIELPYFDVEKGAYGVARSAPIPIKVLPTTEVQLPPDLQAADSARNESVGGMLPVVVLAEGSAPFTLVQTLRSPAVIGMLGLPAVAYLGSVGVLALRRRSERDPAGRRRRGAAARAVRRLAKAGRKAPTAVNAMEIGNAMRGFVADWFDLPEAGLTSAECAERLAGAGVGPEFGAALERCDGAIFGGTGAPVSAPEAQGLVRSVSKQLEGRS